MIQVNRRTFPFSRAPKDVDLRRERTELENVVKFLQEELRLLVTDINTALSTADAALASQLSLLLLRVIALESDMAEVEAALNALAGLIELADLGYVKKTVTGWEASDTIPWEDLTDVPNFVLPQWLSSVAFSGQYEHLRNKPNVPDRREFSHVAFTGYYKHLRQKPLLVGDTMFQFENYR